MNEPNLHIAATALAGENSVKTTHNNYVEFFSHVDNPPTLAQIQTKLVELQAEYDAQEYARNRASAYPSTGDQLDMMYKDTKNSTTTHATAVEAVKTKWPKDNSGPV
jgi:hypothetical protein